MNHPVEVRIDAKASLGEAAYWDVERELLHWVDIEERKVHSFDPQTGHNATFELPERVGTVVPSDRGTLVVALEKYIGELDPDSGEVVQRAPLEQGLVHNRANDGKVGPDGRFFVGTMSMKRTPEAGSFYRVDHDFHVETVLTGVTTSNGLAWSPDNQLLYYSDSSLKRIDVFDYDPDEGRARNRRPLIDFPKEVGTPDGMTVDSEGMIWIAVFHGGCVLRYDPSRAALLHRIDIPAKNVTSVGFGGHNLDELFITTARTGMSDEELSQYPLAGGLFSTKVDVQGLPLPRFTVRA